MIPIDRVASPTSEAADKATRKMITQLKSTLIPRFPFAVTGDAVEYQTARFVTLVGDGKRAPLRAQLRVSDKELQLKPNQSIDMISGMCLFGASGLMGVTEDGKEISLTDPYELAALGKGKITKFRIQNMLHASELETIQRVTRTVQELVQVSDRSGQKGELSCAFHLPAPEYKLYMLMLFQNGNINARQFNELVQVIDERARGLQQIVRKHIPCLCEFVSPMISIDRLLAEKREKTTLEMCVQTLQRDPLFAVLLKTRPPQTLLDLTHLSYSAGYIKTAISARQQNRGSLAVDIAEEVPIFGNAKALSETVGLPFDMAALYVAPFTVTTNGRNGKQALFMHIPDTNEGALVQLKTVMRNSQRPQLR